MKSLKQWAIALVIVGFGSNTSATPVTWTDWTSAVAGTQFANSVDAGEAIGNLMGIEVRYSGEVYNVSYFNGSTTVKTTVTDNTFPLWRPLESFGGAEMSPDSRKDIIATQGFYTGINTISFCISGSNPCIPVFVENPYFAIWSLGASDRRDQHFDFINMTPTFVVGGCIPLLDGTGQQNGCGPITVSGNSVFGSEGSGIVQFTGSYDHISWRDTQEGLTTPGTGGFYGFTVGSIPEPATLSLVSIGLLGFRITRRKNGSK